MAQAPAKRCLKCRKVHRERQCPECKPVAQKQYDKSRPNSNARGYNHKWRLASKRFLADNPVCIECQKQGHIEPSTQTDHIIPHRGDMELFWDYENLQPLCDRHHAAKTRRGE